MADVLHVLTLAPEPLIHAAQVHPEAFHHETTPLRRTLYGLLEGPLKGVFDGPTTTPLDLDAPAVCIDLSGITGTGDTLMAAAMLTTWTHGHTMIEAAHTLTRHGHAAPRAFLAVLDEMWRALRGAPALVEHADALTRVYRHKNVAHLMLTHTLDDLAAVGTDTDRAKARGFLDRCAITAITATSDRELTEISKQRHLTDAETTLVRSWATTPTWESCDREDGRAGGSGSQHHGRGKYLLKAGDRPGIPVHMTLIGDEPELYNTDPRSRLGGNRSDRARRSRAHPGGDRVEGTPTDNTRADGPQPGSGQTGAALTDGVRPDLRRLAGPLPAAPAIEGGAR